MITAEPLNQESFRPFGEVIDPAIPGSLAYDINSGFVTRHHALATVDCDGAVAISVFSARFRPLEASVLERHPHGSQAFMPLEGRDWLVVVADDPVPKACRAFLCNGRQGVNLHRAVWHHPLLVLHGPQTFLVVDRADTKTNLEEVWFRRPSEILV